MNGNNKLFYPRDMFEFIHHPKYGCCRLTPKGPLVPTGDKPVLGCVV
jgi:hypothetical protein